MAVSITNWNLEPNRAWYVRLSDAGSNILVQLYSTQADAQGQTNLQASGNTSGYGSDLTVILTNDSGATYPVSIFQSTYTWHLRVSGQNADATKIFKVKEFVDLPEIGHSIYRNSSLISLRAQVEIDEHTHSIIRRLIALGTHLPEMNVGDIVKLNSTRREVSASGQIVEHRITGEINSLTSSIELNFYEGTTGP